MISIRTLHKINIFARTINSIIVFPNSTISHNLPINTLINESIKLRKFNSIMAMTYSSKPDFKIKKPILFFDDRSPPVRACLSLIKILNINVELKFIDIFKGDQMLPNFVEINKNHTVPALIDEDITLTDSHVIMIYLCEKYGGDKALSLYQTNNFMLRTQVLDKLFFEASVIFRRDSDLMSEIIKKGYNNVDIPYHERKILEIYKIVNGFLCYHKFIASNQMTIADVSFLTTLSTVDLMFQITEDKWPYLHKWYIEMKSMPWYSDGNGNGLLKLKNTFETIGKFRFPNQLSVDS